MRFRSGLTGSRNSATLLPFSGRYLTRLVLLTSFCIVAMVSLGLPDAMELWRGGHANQPAAAVEPIQTAIAPSPFDELGMGVIVAGDDPVQEGEKQPQPVELPRSPPGELPPVDRDLLQHVLDKTSDRAKRPFYHLLTLAAAASPDLLEEHARRDIQYAHLWHEPDRFRGELVRLDGYVRGLHPWQATVNEFFNPAGIQTLYDGYLFTDDSRPNAFVIVVPKVAEGMPTGANISERVTFVGYFLKLWRYKASDGTERAAPLLVGQMVSWTPAPEPEGFVHLSGYLAAAFLLLVLAVGGAIWAINRPSALVEVRAANEGAVIAGLAELEKQIDQPEAGDDRDVPS